MGQKIKYLPTLLDRLLDDEPKSRREAPDKFHFDSRTMRAIVLRDVLAILNNTNIDDRLDEHRHKAVAGSVLNYGVSAVTGGWSNAHSWARIEAAVRNALTRFEPRIVPESLVVRPLLDKSNPSRYGVILFEIRALIYWEPWPVDLCFQGSWDSENQAIRLS
ncbi:type VI secretion system baseplate subunit TssE [Siccibacter turicensis]|uniref:Type VI secretion system baseplate subunit TssE n=1 Tax=Siccibacter turicensis TaxID=357233 RepID=A0A2P8VMD0_9ENTR|nr:GPW/gp25 family protein [Siccibacter turicensis]MDY0969899.1 GPW/gp25 family protein [Siccibacter turicensis]PSN08724.1 type VI secretion system baseplate subunit TssE [Siccibacter turicensis]